MSLSRITSILLWFLMGISAVLVVIFYAGPVVAGTKDTPMEEPTITNFILNWSYVLLGITAIISVIFPLIQIVTNPAGAKRALVTLVIAAVVIFISYSFASDEVLRIVGYTGQDNVPSTLKLVDTGLFTMYILFGGAILAIILSEIARIFR